MTEPLVRKDDVVQTAALVAVGGALIYVMYLAAHFVVANPWVMFLALLGVGLGPWADLRKGV